MDPGGVASNIWKNSAFSIPPLSWVIGNLYAPTRDGAQAVIHAGERAGASVGVQGVYTPPGPGGGGGFLWGGFSVEGTQISVGANLPYMVRG